MNNKDYNTVRYTYHFGESMSPILMDYDFLYIVAEKQIERGDTVLFKVENSSEEEWIAHRVMAIVDERVYTKGDNNQTIDDGGLQFDEIAGIITARWRNGKKLTIYRGKKGIIQYHLYRVYFKVRKFLRAISDKFILPKQFQSVIRRFFPLPKEVHFVRGHGQTKALYLGKIRIGTYSERKRCWQVRFPYRMVYTDKS